jgi:ATP-dependent RNA helicase RhlE
MPAMQVMSLRGGCDVVVATPGRLLDVLYNRGVVNLGQTWAVAVDEADKMLDLGLEPELARYV